MSKPLLSISLLSCGRDDTLWKCLDSLKPIMEAVPSELVIVDTGCSEEINHRMHEYTDLIYPFTWIDDFAAARNCGLEKCSGDWFLFIDDDEWFTDVTEIIQFFISGEYKNYQAATYVVRSYITRGGELYSDSAARRIFSLKTKPRFISKIHEHINLPKCDKHLRSIADHYGYVYATEEEKRNHSLRNIKPLKAMLLENSKDFNAYIHLLQEYEVIEDYKEALQVSRQLIFNLKDVKHKAVLRPVYSYGRYVEYLSLLKQSYIDEMQACGEQILSDPAVSEIAKALVHFKFAFFYWLEKKDDQKTAVHAQAYCIAYDKYHHNETYINEEGIVSLHNTFYLPVASPLFCIHILASLHLGDLKPMQKYLSYLAWDENPILCENFESQFLEAISSLPFDESFRDAMELIWKNAASRKKCLEYIEAMKDVTLPTYRALSKICSNLDGNELPLLCMKIVDEGQEESATDPAQLQTRLTQLIEQTSNYMCLPITIWQIAEQREIDFGPALEAMDYARYMREVNHFFGSVHNRCIAVANDKTICAEIMDETAFVVETIASRLSESSDRWLYLQSAYSRFLIRQYYAEASYQELHDLLESCVHLTTSLYAPYYTETALKGDQRMLPLDYRFALHIKALLDAESDDDMQLLKERIESAASVIPQLKDAILHYATLITEQLKAEAAPASSSQITEEMEALRKQLLEKTAQLRAAGMTDAADQILSQLEKF
ncbi:MAG: glycosyltransferase [Lachnospiraceae bacterium]|nr:glycosyltransferase [Lachnospiraceae bacterium]